MDTRFYRLLLAAALMVPAACAGSGRYEPLTIPQITAGAPERFGAGVVSARPSAIVLDLATPAYVAVARFGAVEVGELVYPLDSPGWQEFGCPGRGAPPLRLEAGRHRLDLPLPWLRVDLLPAARRAAPGDVCRFKQGAWACSSWAAWRFQQQDHIGRYYGALPAPDSLVEHHLVVIVAADPLDVDGLQARLDNMHDARVTPQAAANAAPYYLTARHDGPWAAYTTTVRIQGVR
jgi:hypothetical protein